MFFRTGADDDVL